MNEWLIVLIKSSIAFIGIFAITRLRGKKNIASITIFDYITYAVVAVLTALLITNIIPNWVMGGVAIVIWGLLPIAIEYLSLKSKWIHDFVKGKETILVKDGKVMEENLSQMRMSGEDLLRELRRKNAFSVADVEFALLEATGDINVLLKADQKPVTAHDLGEKVYMNKEPETVILDGNIIDEGLYNAGLTRSWLKNQLDGQGISLDNIFIGQIDSSGDLFIDLFDDSIQVPQPQVKELLYANLEKSQADLVGYSLETEDEKAKAMYFRNSTILKEMMDSLKPHLLK